MSQQLAQEFTRAIELEALRKNFAKFLLSRGYRIEKHWHKVSIVFFANVVRNSQDHNNADKILFTCSDELPSELSRCSFVRTPRDQTTISESEARDLISAFSMQKRMNAIASKVFKSHCVPQVNIKKDKEQTTFFIFTSRHKRILSLANKTVKKFENCGYRVCAQHKVQFACLLLRYLITSESGNNQLVADTSVIPDSKIDFEFFASPLNVSEERMKTKSYCSAFPDTDVPFGSRGSFFFVTPPQGSTCSFNPPYLLSLMNTAAERVLYLLETVPNLRIVCFLPGWSADVLLKLGRQKEYEIYKDTQFAAYDMLVNSKFLCDNKCYSKQELGYHDSHDGKYKNVADTSLLVLRNSKW
jgi:hypothetical protein